MKFISNNGVTDPSVNLSLEEYCIRNLDLSNEEYLLIYINTPCVVVGKHQNVFAETNLHFLIDNSIPVFRRISGGGTVYHDEGNISFSYIRKYSGDEINNYREFTRPVLKTLLDFGIESNLDQRNNILINGKKISGNAQFSNMKRMCSHGTLLFNANLENLRQSLKVRQQEFHSRSVKSVSSSVTNIKEFLKGDVTQEEFIEQLKKNVLSQSFKVYDLRDDEWAQVQNFAREKYRSEKWNYLRCPEFKIKRTGNVSGVRMSAEFEVDKEKIVSVNLYDETGNVYDTTSLVDVPYLKYVLKEKIRMYCEARKIDGDELFRLFY